MYQIIKLLVAFTIILCEQCFAYETKGILAENRSDPHSIALSPDISYIIYYTLNTSHSKSWVQQNDEGVIGVVYFLQSEGELCYRTIQPDGTENTEVVTTGTGLEKSVLLYDSLSQPHIYVAQSVSGDQLIDHYYKDEQGQWQTETIMHFYNEGGLFIYEISAAKGPDHSFHLLVLKTRNDIDSYDYMEAWRNSYLYHLTNKTGVWIRELVDNYNMAYTYDHYIKSSRRQDIKIDSDGFVHVVYAEQLAGSDDPSRLWYASNKNGYWGKEVALSNDFGVCDDAGWFPSLCLDNNDIPYVACMYINRVMTYSAVYCKLYLLKRLSKNNWTKELVEDQDDGYYGSDGHNFTGALNHLIFDTDNTPHLIFSDVASSHWGYQRLCVGNIRYGVYEEGVWNFKTIYHQSSPSAFLNSVEMYDICMVLSKTSDTIRVIGQELTVTGEDQYSTALLDFAWAETTTDIDNDFIDPVPDKFHLSQNFPNPFNSGTMIQFRLPRSSFVSLVVYNLLGQPVKSLINGVLSNGDHTVYWDGTDELGREVSTGMYFYCLKNEEFVENKKLLLLK